VVGVQVVEDDAGRGGISAHYANRKTSRFLRARVELAAHSDEGVESPKLCRHSGR
jgi:hypothetical protein